MDRAALDRLQRQELIELARGRGVERPEVMTRDELVDEILRLSYSDPTEVKSVRGWFGVARDLLAGLVEQGLHLPDAAKVIRGDGPGGVPSGRRPLATVTLAEIYAAQGHLGRGIAVLEEVLDKEPEHEVARRLLSDLLARKVGDGSDENFPEESFAWSDSGPATPAESPAALESRGAPDPVVAEESPAPVLSFIDSADTGDVVVPANVDLSPKAELDLAAPTLRTNQLTEGLPPSDEPGAGVDAEEPEEDTSPNAAEKALEEPTLESIPGEMRTLPEPAPEPKPAVQAADAPEPKPAVPAQEPQIAAPVDASADLESPDSCVLFAQGNRVVMSWRVAATTFARHLEEQPDGTPVVRLVWWVPGLPAARYSMDVSVTQAAGELLVEPKEYGPDAVLRGALGWQRGSGEFVVMATALVCSLAPAQGSSVQADSELLFRPHAAAPAAAPERADAASKLVQRYA